MGPHRDLMHGRMKDRIHSHMRYRERLGGGNEWEFDVTLKKVNTLEIEKENRDELERSLRRGDCRCIRGTVDRLALLHRESRVVTREQCQ